MNVAPNYGTQRHALATLNDSIDNRIRPDMRINFVMPLLMRVPVGGFRVVFQYASYFASKGHRVTIVYPRRCGIETGAKALLKDALWPIAKKMTERPLIPWFDFPNNVHQSLVAYPDAKSVPDADATIATGWATAKPVSELPASKGRLLYLIQHYETWAGRKEDVDASWRLPLKKIVIAKWLQDIGHGLGAADMTHIPNGLDFSTFKVTAPVESRGMGIVTLNHHEPFKGVPDAIEALRRYHATHPDVPVKMFGTMPKGADIPDWIEYYQNPEQKLLVDEIYNTSSVYLGASLEEGWGLPPAEAMACGCTFVGTDIGGFREFAVDGGNALLSPVGDIDRMVSNLVALTENNEMRRSMALRAAEHIRSFTWDRAGSAFLACLK